MNHLRLVEDAALPARCARLAAAQLTVEANRLECLALRVCLVNADAVRATNPGANLTLCWVVAGILSSPTNATSADIAEGTGVQVVAKCAVSDKSVKRTVVVDPIARFGQIAIVGCRATNRRRLGIRRTVIVNPITRIGQIADPCRWTTDRRRLDVWWAIRTLAIAVLRNVANACGGSTDRSRGFRSVITR